TVNSRVSFTGITDNDRSTTLRSLAAFLADAQAGGAVTDPARVDQVRVAFGRSFRSPGHVTLLNGAARGLAERQGHTELSIELLRMAGMTPCAALCEMLDPSSGQALARKDAQQYAQA